MAATRSDPVANGGKSPNTRPAARLGAGLALPALLLALAACETTPDGAPYEANASMGMLIARDSCAGCHETFSIRESPDPDAPPFRAIVNRPGMTPELLATWLKDGHNYPVEMGFYLEPYKVDSLVAYMIGQQAGDPGGD